jgi:hypothetical protein
MKGKVKKQRAAGLFKGSGVLAVWPPFVLSRQNLELADWQCLNGEAVGRRKRVDAIVTLVGRQDLVWGPFVELPPTRG